VRIWRIIDKMISIDDQQKLLIALAEVLPYEINTFAIGGTAMMFYGIKKQTLDIDLVFLNEKDRKIFIESAKSLGYKMLDSKIVYGHKKNTPIMIKVGDARLDLFLEDVISFRFSKEMIKRSNQVHQYGRNLTINIADIHDLILMKCATGRLKDEEDIISIFNEREVDWNILIQEAENQVKIGKESAVLELGNFLEKIKNKKKLVVPKWFLYKLLEILKEQIDGKLHT